MVRTQIQLTEEQYSLLRQAARRQDVAMAELIRRAVDRWLEDSLVDHRHQEALTILGKYRDCAGDVSTQHDRYLSEVWGN